MTFLIGQFCTDGYSNPYRLDRTSHGGGIILYIWEDILSKMIKFVCFSKWEFVSLNETLNRVRNSNPKKASQATDITIKTITENKDLVPL